MNNKGQSLVLFIMILPFILLLLSIVVDVGLLAVEKKKNENIISNAINYELDCESCTSDASINRIRNTIGKNIDNVTINYVDIKADGTVMVSISKKYKGLFSTIVNNKFFNYDIILKGYKRDNQNVLEKG